MVESGVYKLVNVTTGKFYIGSSQNLDKRERGHRRALRRGTHHNIKVQKLADKYGHTDFEFKVIKYIPVDRARKLENRLIKKYDADKRCLNIGSSAIGGDNLTKNPNRGKVIEKMTASVRKHMASLSDKEKRDKYGLPGELNGMHGRTHSIEARKKISQANKGSHSNLGVKKSEEGRANIKKAAQARVAAKGYKNSFKGKTHSEETKAVLRKIALAKFAAGGLPGNARRVKVGKVTYRSVKEASRDLGTCAATIINRIKNPNFPKYKYLD